MIRYILLSLCITIVCAANSAIFNENTITQDEIKDYRDLPMIFTSYNLEFDTQEVSKDSNQIESIKSKVDEALDSLFGMFLNNGSNNSSRHNGEFIDDGDNDYVDGDDDDDDIEVLKESIILDVPENKEQKKQEQLKIVENIKKHRSRGLDPSEVWPCNITKDNIKDTSQIHKMQQIVVHVISNLLLDPKETIDAKVSIMLTPEILDEWLYKYDKDPEIIDIDNSNTIQPKHNINTLRFFPGGIGNSFTGVPNASTSASATQSFNKATPGDGAIEHAGNSAVRGSTMKDEVDAVSMRNFNGVIAVVEKRSGLSRIQDPLLENQIQEAVTRFRDIDVLIESSKLRQELYDNDPLLVSQLNTSRLKLLENPVITNIYKQRTPLSDDKLKELQDSTSRFHTSIH